MSTPLADGLLTQPYVTQAEFLAAPTWLDSQNLIPGGTVVQQGNELYNVLLRASAWADRMAEQRLGAHTVWGQDRFPVDRWGNIYVVPPQNPIRQVSGFAWGSSFQDMTVLINPTAQTWIEREKAIIFSPYPQGTSGLSTIQFGGSSIYGGPWPGTQEVFAQYAIITGYCSTTLSQAAAAGATQVYLTDPTGLQPAVSGGLLGTIPGSVGRIWEPVSAAGQGGEEAFQVAPSWTGGNPVTLAAPLAFSHAAGAGVSELPAEVHQAVISLAVGLLCREDVSDEEPFSGTPFGPTVRKSKRGGKAGGLVDHAEHILHRYKPQVH